MSQKEIIAKLVRQYIQIQSIEEEVKEIKAEAKAIANNKVEELKEKSEQTMELIEESRS